MGFSRLSSQDALILYVKPSHIDCSAGPPNLPNLYNQSIPQSYESGEPDHRREKRLKRTGVRLAAFPGMTFI